jgi:AraC-like DNA-binding protein
MQHAITLPLAGLCLGIALTGLLAVIARSAKIHERLSLGLVYAAFIVIAALPLVREFGAAFYPFYVPLILVMLLILPPALQAYVAAKTVEGPSTGMRWLDAILPLAGCCVCVGFWFLPADAKAMMFIEGALPSGFAPALLALAAFGLILCWLVTSLAYLIAIVRRLRRYRGHIRQLYSNLDARDLRWVDWVIALLVMIWCAGAVSLAGDNLGSGAPLAIEALYVLTACCLLCLTIFASQEAPAPEPTPTQEPSPKYARSAWSSDHAARLANRIEDAMRNDTLYLDPNLSLQKLSQKVGALPNHVSQTLNQEIGTSFFDYVARWRINASKPLILSGDLSVLAVALEVGFNSRSTFYKAFKRETGETPKAYRLSQQA